jgi:DNA adenine methylase
MLIQDQELAGKIVNIASVPHRSPFRYPGGKTWFVPTLRRWIEASERRPKFFVEPFAGGGIVSLTVAFENLAEKVLMVELDENVSAVWKSILGKDNAKLAKLILDFSFNRENVEEILEKSVRNTLQKAFQTIVKNRASHAGIMAPGSGLTKNGESGKGLGSRWYPETLAKRILEIQSVQEKIQFVEGSAFDVLPSYTDSARNFVFVDPPYTAAGKKAGSRLYKHYELDHSKLMQLFANAKCEFLFTYDDSEDLRKMAARLGYKSALIAMKNSHHAKMTELLIGKDLLWLKSN